MAGRWDRCVQTDLDITKIKLNIFKPNCSKDYVESR